MASTACWAIPPTRWRFARRLRRAAGRATRPDPAARRSALGAGDLAAASALALRIELSTARAERSAAPLAGSRLNGRVPPADVADLAARYRLGRRRWRSAVAAAAASARAGVAPAARGRRLPRGGARRRDAAARRPRAARRAALRLGRHRPAAGRPGAAARAVRPGAPSGDRARAAGASAASTLAGPASRALFAGQPGTGQDDGGRDRRRRARPRPVPDRPVGGRQQVHRRDREEPGADLPRGRPAATRCCSSTRPTRCSASAPRCATPTTATPTSRSPTCCSGSRTTTAWPS